MQIVILSGGSGTRLGPLSNDARSKQFLRLLSDPSGNPESMLQRVVRQLREAGINDDITVATSVSQRDAVASQLGEEVDIVTEPLRRHTFPAICLAAEYLLKVKGCSPDETVIVLPCDPFTERGYFETIRKMAHGIENNYAPLMLMGLFPTYPSSKYGYIIPDKDKEADGYLRQVSRFVEKPSEEEAALLIKNGAYWNAGVFAFRLNFITDWASRYVRYDSFGEIATHYEDFPQTSFDYEVVETTRSLGMVEFHGNWKDLGTWNTLTDEIDTRVYGNVITDSTCENTHIFNELDLPLLCIGTRDLVIAASPDGILVTEKSKSEQIKKYAGDLRTRPMYEERRWGIYRVIDQTEAADGHRSLTKRLTLYAGASISYQRHTFREEVWTFVDGEGEIVIGEERRPVKRGMTVIIPAGTMHALRASTPLTFIEVQSGTKLIEEDIERFPYEW